MKPHSYKAVIEWTGSEGRGTRSYISYKRNFTLTSEGKPPIAGSSDPAFRGDATRYNPEEMFVASLSACHMLWYLHLCAANRVTVVGYRDEALGTMEENVDGTAQFVRVVLRPVVVLAAGADVEAAKSLHEEAHHLCFVARSVNFPVEVEGSDVTVEVESTG